MGTLSLRKIAASCLEVTGDFSVNTDVYGYPFRDAGGSLFGTLSAGDVLPGSGEPTARSLRRHLETVAGEATDLVMILVGHDSGFSGAVTRDQATKAQYAIQVARDLYAQVDVGVRRIRWRSISPEEAGGYVNIKDQAEAEDLTDEWSGPDGGVDVFLVQQIGDAAGWSSGDAGPCDKTSKFGFSGAVVELSLGHRFTGIVVGHEVGHYLGLEHADTITNMMGADTNNDGIGEITNNSTDITSGQAATMRSHCSVNGPC